MFKWIGVFFKLTICSAVILYAGTHFEWRGKTPAKHIDSFVQNASDFTFVRVFEDWTNAVIKDVARAGGKKSTDALAHTALKHSTTRTRHETPQDQISEDEEAKLRSLIHASSR